MRGSAWRSFGSTYEGLKLAGAIFTFAVMVSFGSTYEGLKRAEGEHELALGEVLAVPMRA